MDNQEKVTENQNKSKRLRSGYIPVKREKRKLTSKLHGEKLVSRGIVKIPVLQVVIEFRALIAKV